MQDNESVFVVGVANVGLNNPLDGFLPQDIMAIRTSTTWAGAEEVALETSPVAVAELKGEEIKVVGGRMLQFVIRECVTNEDVLNAMIEINRQRQEEVLKHIATQE